MGEAARWTLSRVEEAVTVTLTGPIDEELSLAPLVQELMQRKHIRFDLGRVSRINSCGLREWIRFVRQLPETSTIEFENCAPCVVIQLNLSMDFVDHGKVLSVHAPFFCPGCQDSFDLTLDVSSGRLPVLTGHICSACGHELEFDDLVKIYFSFLSAPTRGLFNNLI